MWPFIILGAAAIAVTALICDDDGDSHESNESHPQDSPPDSYRYRPHSLLSHPDERTQRISGYVRWDGTAVRGYKRRPPR